MLYNFRYQVMWVDTKEMEIDIGKLERRYNRQHKRSGRRNAGRNKSETEATTSETEVTKHIKEEKVYKVYNV
jgi:hypothetical protein